MVRSKEVPKKPKGPLLTPPSKPRGFRDDDGGFGFGGNLPRNRGGAAMSPAPASSVPNYMRATSSSGAKGGRRTGAGVPSSASPTRRGPVRVVTRGRVLFPTPEVPGTVRATCSSTMKEAKFPSALDLAPGATDAQGPAATRVCPYNYCSLNGHTHSPAVPLRSFLASRRRLIKTQQSMKHKGVSAFRKGSGHQRPEDKNGSPVVLCAAAAKAAPLVDEEALGDFFVEVYGGPRVSSEMSCSDMSLDEMDAAVRRMEFVVFDRCGVGEDDEKGGDPAVRGDGDGKPEGERLGFCRDSSSECSDEGVSGLIYGNLVEELPWMRYECDSLDDDVSEEIQEAEGQDGKDEGARSRGSDDKHEKEEAVAAEKSEDEEIISDLPRETGIAAEEEGLDCDEGERRDEGNNISNTVDQQEASTGQETQPPQDDEERVSDVAHKMEIAAEVCSEQKEEDEDNILGKVIQGDTSDRQETSEEKLSNGVYESEVPENELAERVENVLEESREEESSADQEAKDDQTTAASTSNSEVTEKQDMPDDESEMEISETVPSVACEEDLVEEEVTSKAVSEGEISDCSAIASPDVEISTKPTEGGFKQDVNTAEDASEQYDDAVNNSFEQRVPTEKTVDGTKDAQNELKITTCRLEDASEESGIAQESSQIVDSVCVVAAAQMEPEPEATNCKLEYSSEESGIAQEISQDVKPVCVDAAAQMEPDPEVANCKLEDSSEDSGIAQESSQDVKPVYVDAAAQMEPEPEVANCKLEDSTEEFGITQESSQDIKPVCVDPAAQMEPETTKCNLEDTSAEAGVTGETVHDDSLAYVGKVAQVQSEVDTSELVDTSEESGIAHEIGEDDKSASYLSDDAQSDSGITTCKLGDSSEESATYQDHNCADISGGATIESTLTPCEMAEASEAYDITPCEMGEASEAYDITQEAIQDDKTPDVNDGAQKELEMITKCNSEYSSEESGVNQESSQSDNSAYVKEDGAQIEPEFTACKSEDASTEPAIAQETAHDDNSASLGEGPQNQLGTSELEDTSEQSGVAHEIAEDDNSAYVSDNAQSDSGIATCGLIDTSEESVTVQEANKDYNFTNVSGGAKNELADASEAYDISQEAIQVDDAQKGSEIVACESEHAREESGITQEGGEDDYTAGVCAGALKEPEISASESAAASEEVCLPEEANLLPIVVPAPEHNHDLSTTDGHGEPQNVPTEDTVAKGFSIDDMCNVFSGMNLKGGVYVDPTESEISPRKRMIIAGRRRTAEEEEYMRGFNPRAPNFLPLESDPDSEKVDLKHQTAEDRKNAEEWMIDYALRRAVNNLGPARKKKVELLVQAFETVLPHDEDDKKNISPTRPAQACN